MNDIWEKRDQQLQEAVKKAALELWAHQNIGPASIRIPLDEKLWVTIGPKPDAEAP